MPLLPSQNVYQEVRLRFAFVTGFEVPIGVWRMDSGRTESFHPNASAADSKRRVVSVPREGHQLTSPQCRRSPTGGQPHVGLHPGWGATESLMTTARLHTDAGTHTSMNLSYVKTHCDGAPSGAQPRAMLDPIRGPIGVVDDTPSLASPALGAIQLSPLRGWHGRDLACAHHSGGSS